MTDLTNTNDDRRQTSLEVDLFRLFFDLSFNEKAKNGGQSPSRAFLPI